MKSFLTEWAARLKSETPKFFKTMIMLGIALAAIGAVPTSTQITALPFALPAIVLTIGHYFIVIGSTMVLVAKSACSSLGIPVDASATDTQTATEPAAIE